MKATPDAAASPVEYHLLLSRGRPGAWRGFVGIVALLASVLLIVQLVLGAVFSLGIALGGGDVATEMQRLLDTDAVTPAGLAFLNLTLAAAIPTVWLLVRWLHGLPIGWLSSVAGRMRWSWLLTCLGLAAVTLLITLVVGGLVPDRSEEHTSEL